ncbi:hypothetical protein [Asticcacaulis sp. MM231]|uniref:hypothetical protein n=1 Tax=Asticcacaulis sp. MM231 TaxID=3157666 RepID=UPI0032D5699B
MDFRRLDDLGVCSYIFKIEAWHRTPRAMVLFGGLTVIVALRAVAGHFGLKAEPEPEPSQ